MIDKLTNWFAISPEQLWGIGLSALLTYLGIIAIIRVNGLRSFSKMSGHDFAITVAVGSIIASTVVSDNVSVLQGLFSITVLFVLQSILSFLRMTYFSGAFENTPILLMDKGNILHENMKKAKSNESDLTAKLREANVLQLSDVQAVVLETTGDVSVLHGSKNIEDYILKDVRK